MPPFIQGQPVSDFRSDTVTRPSAAMRQAMAEAVVGDDVFADDPTVQELEAEAAAAFGKEAGLFTPSGTMANLIAISCHSSPGDEVFLEEYAHSYNFEVGSAAAYAGVVTRTFKSDRGQLDPAEVERFARPGDLHAPRTALLVVENTHNFHGGAVVPLENLQALRAVCDAKGMAFHLDGARIWNAVAASGVDPQTYGGLVDSLMFCCSKGLGAPIGSVLVGTQAFIDAARRIRKRLGGGMRQVGVIAAPALIALREGPKRLHEDHAHAKALAEGIAAIEGAVLDPALVETNIVFMKTEAGLASYGPIADALEERGVRAIACGELGVRFVCHLDVGREDVERALTALGELVPAHGQAGVGA